MSGNRFSSNTSGDTGEHMNHRDPSQIDSEEPCAKKAKIGDDVTLDQSLQFKGNQIAIDKNGEQTMRTFSLDSLPFELKKLVVGKMSIDSLCKFRRTSKENEEFVRKYRRHFHFEPEMNLKAYCARIYQRGTDPVTFDLKYTLLGPSQMKLTWDERWELRNAHISALLFDGVPLEVVHDFANLLNAREVGVGLEFSRESLAVSRLPFIQQWQTDKGCLLKKMRFDCCGSRDRAAFINMIENDGRFQKIWDRAMPGFRDFRTIEVNEVDLDLHCVYFIERDFEVDNLGQIGVLVVSEDRVCFFTRPAGEIAEENLED